MIYQYIFYPNNNDFNGEDIKNYEKYAKKFDVITYVLSLVFD